jgi:molybdate transport system ATP-binding protein
VKRFAAGPVIRVHHLRTSSAASITVLFGPSGSGKTTVLRCLAGLERPDEGSIWFGGEVWFDAAGRTCLPSRARNLGFVPQDYALFPHLSVERNVAYGLDQLPAGERQQRVAEAMDWLGLAGLEKRAPRELSGGQQQRVALARAVVRRPRLLLLDEPLAALDAPTRQRLRGELRQLLAQLGIPTLLVTHDRTEAVALGDDLVVMDHGEIVQQGTVPEVFSRPATPAVAGALAVETIEVGTIVGRENGLLSVAVGTARLIALDPALPADATRVLVCIRAEDVVLTGAADPMGSPRNHLAATIRRLIPEGPVVRVTLDCGFPLVALVTKPGCEALALREGGPVAALIKAPNVHLIPQAGANPRSAVATRSYP